MSDSRSGPDLLMLTGALFPILLIAGNLIPGATDIPSPFDPRSEIERYFITEKNAMEGWSFVQLLSALALTCFTAALATFARRTVAVGSVLPGLILAGGALAAGDAHGVYGRDVGAVSTARRRARRRDPGHTHREFLHRGAAHVSLLGQAAAPSRASAGGSASARRALKTTSDSFRLRARRASVFVLPAAILRSR
jgi:hypothetical protein